MPELKSKQPENIWATPEVQPEDLDRVLLKLMMEDENNPIIKGMRMVLQKMSDGEMLSPGEQMAFKSNSERWWNQTYNKNKKVPFSKREQVLRQEAEKAQERHKLQEQLLAAVKADDLPALKELKKVYKEKYPDQRENIEILFGLRDFFLKQKKFVLENEKYKQEHNGEKRPFKEVKEPLRDLTEYQYLFTHFLIIQAKDRNFLEGFWRVAKDMAEATANPDWPILASGLRSQAAAYWIMKEIGHNPQLSKPRDDAWDSIDMWGRGEEAIQIKGFANEETPGIFKINATDFPAIEVSTGKNSSDLYTSNKYWEMKEKSEEFKIKLDKYGKGKGEGGTDIKYNGYFMVLPGKMIDRVSCKPSELLVQFFRREIGGKQQVPEAALAA